MQEEYLNKKTLCFTNKKLENSYRDRLYRKVSKNYRKKINSKFIFIEF